MPRKRRAGREKSEVEAATQASPRFRDDIKSLVTEADQQRKIWKELDEAHRVSLDANRLLQACANYASPGESTMWIDPNESEAVCAERRADNPDWKACNSEFCEAWVKLWVASVHSVRKATFRVGDQELVGAAALRAMSPASPGGSIIKNLYLQLLESECTPDDVARVVDVLVATRLELRGDRFLLRGFFPELLVVRRPPADQVLRERRKPPVHNDDATRRGGENAPRPAAIGSSGVTRKAVLAGADERNASPDAVEAASDFSWMRVHGVHYDFRRPQQAKVIGALFDEWQKSGKRDGCGLRQETLAEMVGAASSFRVHKLFLKHPALNTILRSPHKGTWALFLSAQ